MAIPKGTTMNSLRFTAETTSDGVVERDFTLGDVTGVLWAPASGPDHAPLVLMGHGGGLHKKTPGLAARARHLAATCGYTVAAIDAPADWPAETWANLNRPEDVEAFRRLC